MTQKHQSESSQAAGSGQIHTRIKRAGEENFSEVPPIFDEAGKYAHTDYQEAAREGFHIHWRVLSGEHGPGPDGTIVGGMVHDLIAPDVETALAMAREASDNHREFVVNAQFQHHAHAGGESTDSPDSPDTAPSPS